jgi:hypothetical protein
MTRPEDRLEAEAARERARSNAPFDATYAELEREDRAWSSDAEADFAADREWGRRFVA